MLRHSSAFALPFHERFVAWQKANAEALTKGASIVNERGMNGPTIPSLQSFATMNAQILDALPDDDRQRRCDELLTSLSVKQKWVVREIAP